MSKFSRCTKTPPSSRLMKEKNHSFRPKEEESSLWLYGKHPVIAALNNPTRQICRLLATPEALMVLEKNGHGLTRQIPVPILGKRGKLDQLLGSQTTHQGLALETYPLPNPDWQQACTAWKAQTHIRLILLDQVSDPRNVGAILRSAAVFGASGVIMQKRHAPPESGALAKAACGALETVPLWRVTNLTRVLNTLAEIGFWRLCLDHCATRPISTLPRHGKWALIMGAEDRGVRRLISQSCDFSARLTPLPDNTQPIDSLNVATATAIALYALSEASTHSPFRDS